MHAKNNFTHKTTSEDSFPKHLKFESKAFMLFISFQIDCGPACQ